MNALQGLITHRFPEATVHVSGTEYATAQSGGRLRGLVYIADHRGYGPKWEIHEGSPAVDWFGFDAFPALDGPGLQVMLVPLPGHTRGHCGVAVGDGSQWILHCGDAVAVGALETRPGSIAALPLGPHFLKLQALAQAQAGRIRLMPAHVRVEDLPELANPANEFAADRGKRVGGEGRVAGGEGGGGLCPGR